jgi:hypothetical protein
LCAEIKSNHIFVGKGCIFTIIFLLLIWTGSERGKLSEETLKWEQAFVSGLESEEVGWQIL